MYGLELAGEDDSFAIREAAVAAGDVRRVGPGLAIARTLDRTRVQGLAYTRAASRLLGRTAPDIRAARTLVEEAPLGGSDGPTPGAAVAVRARDVRGTAGISTSTAERELGDILVERGFDIDLEAPERELRVLFAEGVCLVGWLVAETVRDFGTRRPTDRPFFQPGSMDPLDARAIANLAGAGPGRVVLDPMCGTGGILIEAGLVGSRVIGIDAQDKMVRGSRQNLEAFLTANETPFTGHGEWSVARGDATCLPLDDDSVDAIVVDTPYGRQSKVAGSGLEELVAAVLTEGFRVGSRGVVVSDRGVESAAMTAGWDVEAVFERPVHRSLTRYVHVLDSTEPCQ